MSRPNTTLGLALLTAICCVAGSAQDEWSSEPPITYVLDYGNAHLGNAQWLEDVRNAPPTLLHLGKDVPMTHNWGPIAALGGENQAYGKGDSIRRLTPDEVAARIAGLTRMVADLHDAGVRLVMPYICSNTVAGHPDSRAGLWEFYDHWDEYASFGLGPRPEVDVTDWLQRDPQGNPVRFYAYTGDFYPPYEPNHREAACVNNPAWQAWLSAVVRLVAGCGYDGCFVDNSGSQRCYCAFCQEAFREFLSARYRPEELERLFGFARTADIHLSVEREGLLWAETQRFWLESLRRHQIRIRQAGESVKPDFRTFPNGGHQRPEAVKLAFRDSDYVMFEKSLGDYGTHPGRARFKIVGDIAVNKYNDSIYEYCLTRSVRSRVKPIILTRPGYPRRDPELEMNDATARLGMAEAAAFGSGGGFLIRPDYRLFGPALSEYRAFFETHGGLYTGRTPIADVGIALLPEQVLYLNRTNASLVERLTRTLVDDHVLFEYLLEEDLVTPRLSKYRAVILPGAQVLSIPQLEALEEYVRSGGHLLVFDPLPRWDTRFGELDQSYRELPAGETVPLGSGRILRSTDVPRRDVAGLLRALTGEGFGVLSLAGQSAPAWVRVAAWKRPAGSPQRVYHVLNYGAPLGEKASPPLEVAGLELEVPARENITAEVWTPGRRECHRVTAQAVDGAATIKLPPLGIYQVVVLR